MSDASWGFNLMAPLMPNTTELFFKSLPNRFSPEEILVREALQNSRDAWSEEARARNVPPNVTMRKRSIEGEELKQFAGALQLSEASPRAEHLRNYEVDEFEQLINGKTSISILEIEDKNTHGLGGNWRGRASEDHFSRLTVNLGASLKVDGGGSYGFGKTVFASKSRLNLVIYYSVFEASKESNGVSARLMGMWAMKDHDFEGRDYDGYVFFGKPDPDEIAVASPFNDDEAHEMAERLGIKRRTSTEKGTTVLVVDCDRDLSMEKIKDAVERYWWPSIEGKTLSVRVYDEEQRLPIAPKDNPRVEPFITCFNDLAHNPPSGKSAIKNEKSGSIARKFQKFRKMELGCWVVNTLSELKAKRWIEKEEEFLSEEDKQEARPYAGGVAKLRSSGMVISYDRELISSTRPCVAIFKASDDIDQILRLSEPQTHDKWDSEADRLNEAEHFENFEKDLGKSIVKTVNQRIKNNIRDYQKETPDPAPPENYKLKMLDSLAAKIMNAGKIQPGVDPGKPRPITHSVSPVSKIVNGRNEIEANILISLNDDYHEDAVSKDAVVILSLLGDSNDSSLEVIPCTVIDPDGNKSDFIEKVGALIPVVITKGKRLKLQASASYEKGYKLKCEVQIRDKAS